ncbi:MAG TPA: hypothetical protein VLK65_13255 [Vicinamibacteria bacterium]|nr:hypothetical protein [Vicinamibacteria bacterium]
MRYRFAIIGLLLTLALVESGFTCSFGRGVRFHYHDRPGVERDRFLSGELGVLETSFDRIYLYVAYRYLTGRPLSEASTERLEAYWRKDAPSVRIDHSVWGRAVSDVRQEQITRDGNVRYLYYLNCNPNAFATASATLEERSARYGESSLEVRRWIEAQTQVFQNCARGASIPDEPGEDWEPLERADRVYQIAAAHFYSRSFLEAAERFAEIAEDEDSPWRDISAYLVARAYLRQAVVGDGPRGDYLARAEDQLQRVLADPEREAVHGAARSHLDYVRTLGDPATKLAELEAELLGELQTTFPRHWLDYLRVVPRVTVDRPELSAWFLSLSDRSEDVLGEAHRRWKENGEASWLVALLMRSTASDTWLDEVLAGAAEIPVESAAFWTAAYHRARLLLDAGRIEEARKLLDELPAALSLSDHNRFEGLRARAARSVDEFLSHGAMVPVRVGITDGNSVFSHPGDGLESLRDGRRFLESDVVRTINRHFSPDLLIRGARSEGLPEHLRREAAWVAFSRAFVTGDADAAYDAAGLASDLAPELRASLADYRNAGTDAEREFAGALTMLRFPGLGPSVRDAAARVAPLDRIGDFRDTKWWCVVLDYDVERPRFVEGDSNQTFERLTRLKPAPIHLGEMVLRWSDSHRDDPRVPEALHLVVRATRYGCNWIAGGEKTDYGDVSKAAFDRLHRRYASNPWTERTKYWYR